MLRRPLVLARRRSALAAVLAGGALAATVKVRVEGKTQTIFGAAQPPLQADNALAGARRRQPRRRVLLRADDGVVRQLRQPDRQVPGRRQHRLGVQGERRLAARRRRQGRAEGRRRRALVLRRVRPGRRAADARAAAAAGQLLPRRVRRRRRQADAARAARRCASTAGASGRRAGPRLHRPAHAGSSARRSPAPCARTPSR